MDKRKLSRVVFQMEAELTYKGMAYKAEVKNVSLKGALVTLSQPLDIEAGEKLDMVLYIKGHSSNLEISAKSLVVRKEGNDIGLKLEAIDLDSFIHLKNIIVYNSGDYDKIMEEFYNHSV